MMLTTRRLAVAILFIGLFAMATRVSVAADTWWHMRAGQWMVEHRTVLKQDVFSHTRAGQPWLNIYWLSQIPLYLVWDVLGFAGPNLLTTVMVVLTFIAVYHTCEGGEYLRAFVIVLASSASGVYWTARPHLVTFLLTAVFGLLIDRFRRGRENRLWLLIPLMAIWVNMHGGFVVGFILLALTILGEGLKVIGVLVGLESFEEAPEQQNGSKIDRWMHIRFETLGIPERTRAPLRRMFWMMGVGLACAAAAALNPNGLQVLLLPLQTVSIGVLQDFIQEWQSPNFHPIEVQVFIWLLLATIAVIGLSRQRIDVTDFFLLAVFVYLALLARRNIAIFAVIAAPVLARHASALLAELQERYHWMRLRDRPLSSRLMRLNWLLLALIILAALVKVSIPLEAELNENAAARFLPVEAVAHIRVEPPSGKMFNSYNWGGYLTWALYPDAPVFVDGRTDLYDDDLLTEYLVTAAGGDGWEATLEKYDIGFVLIETGSGLDRELAHDAGWEDVYRDAQAVIYERRQIRK